MMRRHHDSDDDDYYGGGSFGFKTSGRLPELDLSQNRKKFVSAGGGEAPKHSYGIQRDLPRNEEDSSTSTTNRRPLTADEKNALSAKILKAELSGKAERVKELKRKLESGYADVDRDADVNVEGSNRTRSKESDHIILMKMDKKSGLITPATSVKKKSGAGPSSTMMNVYEKSSTLQELIDEEKQTTAEDQLNLFERATGMTAANKVNDDYVVDDNVETHRKKRRHAEKDDRKTQSRQISEHKQLERTLAACQHCFERAEKLTIVAVGFKTYLAVVPWKGVGDFHCRIIPSEHCISTVNLDEDVHAEMKIWRKGLVAMFGAEDEDCIFVETAKVESGKNHMSIECIPMPRESGDLAPIYFKQAFENEGSQWSTHKKIFNLTEAKDKTVRSLIPKGFSYVAVDFGLQPGYAHVIEKDEDKFPSYFAQEIIGGILDLEHKRWRNVDMESKQELKNKRDKFKERWSQFDWTEEARRRLE